MANVEEERKSKTVEELRGIRARRVEEDRRRYTKNVIARMRSRAPLPQGFFFGKSSLERMHDHYSTKQGKASAPDRPRVGHSKPADGGTR